MPIPLNLLITATVIALAVVAPRLRLAWVEGAIARLELLSRRPVLSVIFVGLVALAGNILLSSLVRTPLPAVHDEFSYLLPPTPSAGAG